MSAPASSWLATLASASRALRAGPSSPADSSASTESCRKMVICWRRSRTGRLRRLRRTKSLARTTAASMGCSTTTRARSSIIGARPWMKVRTWARSGLSISSRTARICARKSSRNSITPRSPSLSVLFSSTSGCMNCGTFSRCTCCMANSKSSRSTPSVWLRTCCRLRSAASSAAGLPPAAATATASKAATRPKCRLAGSCKAPLKSSTVAMLVRMLPSCACGKGSSTCAARLTNAAGSRMSWLAMRLSAAKLSAPLPNSRPSSPEAPPATRTASASGVPKMSPKLAGSPLTDLARCVTKESPSPTAWA